MSEPIAETETVEIKLKRQNQQIENLNNLIASLKTKIKKQSEVID